MNSDVLNDLKWRGLISQTTDSVALQNALTSGSIKFYCGFDPTAPSLHHGNLVQLILMRHLQNAGHTPICLIGGATGLIGDPRLTGERVLNDGETVALWGKNLENQFKKFLKFDGKNAAQVLNNYEWTANLSAIDFLREVGKNFRMGAMLSKDTVKSRLGGDGLSFTEFSYQILQGYDYFVLNRDYGVTLQTGGQDQWGNLTSGLDLIHRLTENKVHVMTTPLITKADGTKFGKSEGGAIWLDPQMMSPYNFYQFWLNVEDSEVINLLKVFTFLSREDIDELSEQVNVNPGTRLAQRTLASEITRLVHGENATKQCIDASNALFGRGDLHDLTEETLDSAIEGLEVASVKLNDEYVRKFVETKLVNSTSEYRKTLASGGGFYINNRKISDLSQTVADEDFLQGKYILLRKGKRNLSALQLECTESILTND